MPWRIDPERIVREAGGELKTALGDELRTLVVYGSAAGADFDRTRSDVNFAAVLDPLEFAHLERAAQWWARWHRRRVAAPLLLSASDLARSRDVFPLELLDIQARHRTLAGAELFAELAIAPECVRAACVREAAGKLVRLRELYLELAGSARYRRALMLDSRKTFLHVMRGLLHLRGEPWSERAAAVVTAFERHYSCHLPVLQALARPAPEAPIESRFRDYLREVETIAALAGGEEPAPS